jgi:nitrogen-specific signal transduction histidine kinase
MLLVLASELNSRELELLQAQLPGAMIIPASDQAALDLVRSLPLSLFVAQLEPLTTVRLQTYLEARESHPHAVTICLAPEDVRDQLRSEQVPVPDFWLSHNPGAPEVSEVLRAALPQALLRMAQAPWPGGPPGSEIPPAEDPRGDDQRVLQQLLSMLVAQPDSDRLLAAYAEVVAEQTRCAGYCLLRRNPELNAWTVHIAKGLPPEIVAHGLLGPSDALVGWYRNSCRALTRAELPHWPDTALAGQIAQELAVFRGQVALPLLVAGRLEGLLLLGEKIVGESYARGELETLFLLSSLVALQLENLQIQSRLLSTKIHLERSVLGMECGLLTMNEDHTVAVCNPYAARVLGRPAEEIEGADLRNLPSPLGDYLYAAWHAPEATVIGREVTLAGTDLTLRISTSRLLDDQGQALGSALILEDVTGPLAKAARSLQRATVDTLTRIIGRIAHEMRTPLTAMKTYAELMKQPAANGDLDRFWKDVVGPEVTRLDHLIGDQVRLLERTAPDLHLVDLGEAVREVVNHILPPEPHSEFSAEMHIEADLPLVVLDPAGTRDALTYLVRFMQRECESPLVVTLARHATDPATQLDLTLRARAPGRPCDPAGLLDPLRALEDPQSDLGPAIAAQVLTNQGSRLTAEFVDGTLTFAIHFPVTVTLPVAAPEGDRHGTSHHSGN